MTIDLPEDTAPAAPIAKACPRCGKPLAEHDIEITATRAQVNCREVGDYPFEI